MAQWRDICWSNVMEVWRNCLMAASVAGAVLFDRIDVECSVASECDMRLRFEFVILVSVFSLFLANERSISAESEHPSWVQARIKSKEPLEGIEKYRFKQSTVYLVQTVCCDHGNRQLFDENGKLICELEEGFTGLDDSKCPGFNEDGEWIESIYSRPPTPEQAEFLAELEKEKQAARKIVLTDESYGAIKFGRKLSDIEKSIGQKAWRHPFEGYNDLCRYVSFKKYSAVSIRVEKGIVTQVDASDFDSVTTSLGIGYGMLLTDVQAKFPSVRVVPDEQNKKVRYAIFESKDRGKAIVFTVRKGRLSSVRAGLWPSVERSARCP